MDGATESDADILWDDVINSLEEANLPAASVAMLRSCSASSLDDGMLTVLASSRFVQRTLGRLSEQLDKAASEVAFQEMHVEIKHDGSRRRTQRPTTPTPEPEPPRGAQSPRREQPKARPKKKNPLVEDITPTDSLLTFDRFVEGPQNKFAFDAAKQVANGNRNYNPLFIYGKSGLGKTHLLRAIQNYIALNDPQRACAYRVATDFIDDYSRAMKNARSGAAEALADNYHSIDVLIIDDVQLMSTAAGTIGFFFDTFNFLVGHGKQIVLAADRTPSELGMGQSKFDERVTSRLDSGMTVSIQVPDYELKTSNNWCTLVHPFRVTPYKGRCFYTVVQSTAMSLPLGAFSATMDTSGKIASQRLVFENGYAHPIDFAVVGGNLYVMTVKRNTTSSIEHGIWKTHDGVSFEKLAVFTTDQYFESFTYAKGHFYLGYGCAPVGYGSFASSVATPETDKAGQIWRFSLPQADDDGSNDGLTPYVPTYDASAWYMGELGVTNLLNAGITGKGIKVGMVDTGIRPIVNGSVTNMAIDVLGGDTSQTASHGLGVASIIKSDKFGIAPECTLYAYNGRDFVDDINGIWWCFTNGCRVVNFSGGYTPFYYTEQQLAWATAQIRTMLAQGLILVAAGGK